MNAFLRGRGQADHNDRVGSRSKILRSHPLAILHVTGFCQGSTDVETAFISRYALSILFVHMFDGQCAQWLVIFAIVSLHFLIEVGSLAVILLVQRFSDCGYSLVGFGRMHLTVRFSCPQGEVVQRKYLFRHSTIDNGSHLSVTNHQCLFKVFCRSVIV